MPRPKKWRTIEFVPKHTQFKPCGVPKSKLEEVQLKIEELEAMRLKDIEGLNQAECAEKMSVSRQTFQLIIESARRKVTDTLIEGKSLNITGGNYTYNLCDYKCIKCKSEFTLNYEGEQICPNCGSLQIRCTKDDDFCVEICCRKDF